MPPPDVPDGSIIDSRGPDDELDARGPDGTPPRVLSTSPEPGTTGVAPSVQISVTFDEAIDPKSVDGSSFRVVDGHGRAVLGTTIVEGADVRFAPAAELTLRERYKIEVGTGVADVSGTPLDAEWQGVFTVREGALGVAVPVFDEESPSWAMGMGERGDVFALWWEPQAIYSRRYQSGSWGDTELVSPSIEPYGIASAVGLEDAALAVWEAGPARKSALYVSGPVPWVDGAVSSGGGPAQVGIDVRELGLAAWLESDGASTGVLASRFSGAQWSDPVRLDGIASDASSLHLAVGHAGDGMALWAQDGKVWTARFHDGAWAPAAPIEAAATPAIEPRLVIDGDGRGMALWIQRDGAGYRLRWSRHEPQTGWSEPAFADGGPAVDADQGVWRGSLAFNSNGDAVALWHDTTRCEIDETPCYVLLASRFTLARGWHGVETIDAPPSPFGVAEPTVAIDRHGSVLAAWTLQPGDRPVELWVRRYVPDQGWEAASPASCADGIGFRDLALYATPQGRMLASWSQQTGERGDVRCALVLD